MRPVTAMGLEALVPTPGIPPSIEVQDVEKVVIGDPFAAPGVTATLKEPLPAADIAPIVGADGTSGVVADAMVLARLVPSALVATTEHE